MVAQSAIALTQGEDQKKLDVVSNDVFCNALRSSGRTGTIASEEEDVPVAVEETDSGDIPSQHDYRLLGVPLSDTKMLHKVLSGVDML